MPMISFSCGKHSFEAFHHTSSVTEMKCRFCRRTAKKDEVDSMRRGVSSKYEINFAQGCAPTVIHRNAKGEVRFPMHPNAPVPKGYVKVEMNTSQVRRFEREMNEQKRVEYVNHKSRERERLLSIQKQNRSDLRHAISTGTTMIRGEDGKMRRVEFSEADKDFARYAMETNDDRRIMEQHFDPGFCVEALSYDSSNRDVHRDQLTGWKGRK